jgi:hypothetical protein
MLPDLTNDRKAQAPKTLSLSMPKTNFFYSNFVLKVRHFGNTRRNVTGNVIAKLKLTHPINESDNFYQMVN